MHPLYRHPIKHDSRTMVEFKHIGQCLSVSRIPCTPDPEEDLTCNLSATVCRKQLLPTTSPTDPASTHHLNIHLDSQLQMRLVRSHRVVLSPCTIIGPRLKATRYRPHPGTSLAPNDAPIAQVLLRICFCIRRYLIR